MLQTQRTHKGEKAGGPKVGLALAGGGPLGGIYEIGALLALNEAIDGLDFHDVDVYVGVSAGSLVASTLANGISVEEMAVLLVSGRGRPQRFDPGLFLRPAFREYLRRSAALPRVVYDGVVEYLKDPLNRGLLESLGGLARLQGCCGINGIDLELRQAVNSGLTPGPRMLASGRLICMTGGHGWQFGREADGPDDVRRAAREQIKAGADIVKLMATGGVMTPGVEPGSEQLTEAEMRAGVETLVGHPA
ncbi:MAG: patatin-like phospholipase family protein, partial [Gammaproteobacteria bacterium]